MTKEVQKLVSVAVVVAVVAGGAGYVVGSKVTSSAPGGARMAGAGFGQGGAGGPGGRGGTRFGGAVAGEITALDDTSLTVKGRDGSSRIVFMGNSTQVSKSTTGGKEDLKIGVSVMVNGTANPDGSVSAQMVSIRPASSTMLFRGPGAEVPGTQK